MESIQYGKRIKEYDKGRYPHKVKNMPFEYLIHKADNLYVAMGNRQYPDLECDSLTALKQKIADTINTGYVADFTGDIMKLEYYENTKKKFSSTFNKIFTGGIIRNYPGGIGTDASSAWLSAPDITNVWFCRSGGNVSGRKDILWRRYGEEAFSLYNLTDGKTLFSIQEDGKVMPREGIVTVGFDTQLLYDNAGISLGAIGTSYVDILTDNWPFIDFSMILVRASRIIISAVGNETGTGKGIKVLAGSAVLGEVVWDGSTKQENIRSSWNSINLDTSLDTQIKIQAKASSATETITVYALRLQLLHGTI